MSRRHRRTTRTITFRGGPDDGIVGQHPVGYDEIRANTVFHPNGEAIGWDEYRGPGGAGAAEFHFTRHVGTTHEEFLRGTKPPAHPANVYVAPAGSPLATLDDLRRDSGPWTEVRGVRDLGVHIGDARRGRA